MEFDVDLSQEGAKKTWNLSWTWNDPKNVRSRSFALTDKVIVLNTRAYLPYAGEMLASTLSMTQDQFWTPSQIPNSNLSTGSQFCLHLKPTSSTYLLTHVIDTESKEQRFIRIERVKPGGLKLMKKLWGSVGFPKDMIFPSDGIIKKSEWVSMSLDLHNVNVDINQPNSNSSPNSSSRRLPTYHFEDLWVAVVATHNSSHLFSMVEPHNQGWWFCYISMIVLGLSLKQHDKIVEHGLDDTGGKVEVCLTWKRVKQNCQEDEGQSHHRQIQKFWGGKVMEYEPVCGHVAIEKVVQPTLRSVMCDVQKARALDDYCHRYFDLFPHWRRLWSADA
ncbi:hypothetical protein CPB83DRAFT_906135 [Crepidotus variabilis]|uniref:Uncharacterized protein n=1 Tax=Crepidotus variabilis TaxID=179855 RepID=A0A9P6JQR1_9AGAR|nr:hypothetical protein CPB83DRAFT_906135 [Crepidotus variabilis]